MTKKKEIDSPIISAPQEDTICSADDEMLEYEFDIKNKYIDIVVEHLKIKKDDYILDFSDIATLPGKEQTIVLIPEYISGQKDTNDNFSIYMRLFILDNASVKIIGQLNEDTILVSSALMIEGISLNTTSYQFVRMPLILVSKS